MKRNNSVFKLFALVGLISVSTQAFSQDLVDKVVAIVGTKVILHSDIEKQYVQYVAQGGVETSDVRCTILDQLLLQKLMINQADIDSVTVADAQVEGELDRRMRYYIKQIGSEEKLEEYFHTSIRQLKSEFRDIIKEQLLVQTMQSRITKDVSASPSDARTYFESIPVDSLPYMDAEMEIAQIVKMPVVTPAEKLAVRNELEEYRKKILSGEGDFAVYAALYSKDPSSAKKGGELGFFERGTMVPEFEAAAFTLKPGEISPVIETKFGFHILQLIERRGDQINIRHILLQPTTDDAALAASVRQLDSLRTQIISGTITFEDAAQKFSSDDETKNNGGLLINPETNTTKLSPDKIDRLLFFQVDSMELGKVSAPLIMNTPDGKTAYRLVMLKSRTQPHKANLRDDYTKIQEVATSEKQNKVMSEWVAKKIKTTYIQFNDDSINCAQLDHWKKQTN
ncbi:MAG: peptidylprolyl isomerase [Bacteroidetes bacterium]|jgi:peptidyl-prolyl cis-trans isomerase SurA|nr:peptidylprolyl isomerase [Bacteroidota bacterium]